ncbi:hypothetical protein K493DRAFT_22287 [Basidiobolus meristosporus CBS 931.73]|uniref:Phosphatidylglycerol/phosphatidylinositol transfer protein n=1 Tax=Basidiobolus meristosporus CBS 931.73 TaxID=1314790 RepID=A0A1Y1YDW6_9FUNG|nr:hypothetical protein K493DRAFT_22287 [Basidiobolus meristosporus CBS 931.73]|eukprot:ORX95906.1 hypothetical protein K493DRAFT_22287 [Basidiobolus meristosporus CBS 931.73]
MVPPKTRYTRFSLPTLFTLFIALLSSQSVLSNSPFLRCGNPAHSWDPIDGTAKFDIGSRSIDIQVTGVAKDSLVGVSTSTPGKIATALYIVSTLNYRSSVVDPDLCASLGKCPTSAGNVTLNKVLSVPNYSPFVDVNVTGVLIDENNGEYGCFTVLVSQTEETYNHIVTIVMLCTLALPILTLAFAYFFGDVQDIFAYTSNLGVTRQAQSLRYPSFFDLVYHLQFLVVLGLLNLDYSLFYQQFLFRLHSVMGILGDSVTNGGAIKAQASSHLPIEDRGITFFTHFVGLEPSGLLVSLLILMAFVLLAVLVVSGLIIGVAVLVMRSDGSSYSQKKLFAFTLGNILRFLLLFHLPLTLFAFNQLMIHDPIWLTVVAAVLVVVVSFAIIGGSLIYLTKFSQSSTIFIDAFYILMFGPLYNNYTPNSYRYAWVRFGDHLVLAAIVAFGQSNGLVQLVLVLCREVALFYAILGVHPYVSTSVNVWEGIYQAFRVVLVALLFVYLPAVKASSEAKDWCGLISVFMIMLFQLLWAVRAIMCLVEILIHRCAKPRTSGGAATVITSTSHLPSRPRGASSHISGSTSVMSGPTLPKMERPFSSESAYDAYRPKSDNPSFVSLSDGMSLSPYDRYMANLRESAGLRQEVLIDDTTDTRSSGNLSVSTFSPKPAFISHHSPPSQSSFIYEDLPQGAAGFQRTQTNLPKFFSANND